MRGTRQTMRLGETTRLQLRHATATVIWVESAQRTVIHVKDKHHTRVATAACSRLMTKLPYPVARFDTSSAAPSFLATAAPEEPAPVREFGLDVDRATG